MKHQPFNSKQKENTRILQAAAIGNNKNAQAISDNRTGKALQQKANNTGLPNQLKSGIENLSGHSMDDVKVHYNSAQPAELNAHAYAQGTDIHIAPGQEKHLPHEAWHVVQQKQGRVQPTKQLKGKVYVNDNKGLEKEADTMGAKAGRLTGTNNSRSAVQRKSKGGAIVIQRFPYERMNKKTNRVFKIIQHGNEIEAIQVKGNEEDIHYGSLIFKITNFRGQKVFELSHIISDPEVGSGLGSLLVFYMAMLAQQLGFDTIEIPTAASTAVGFYEHMGWAPVDPRAARLRAQQFFESPGHNEEVLGKHFDDSARIEYNSDPENHATKRRSFMGSKTQLTWEKLGKKEQGLLVKAQENKFMKLSADKRLSIVNTLNYNKAVANVGMTGKTDVIKGKAFSSTLNTWTDNTPPTFEKAWDSRFNKTTLSEFPRHPDE